MNDLKKNKRKTKKQIKNHVDQNSNPIIDQFNRKNLFM